MPSAESPQQCLSSSSQQSVEPGDLVDERVAATIIGVTASCLQAWRYRYSGRGPAFHKFGRSVRYSRKMLAEWIAAQRVG